MKIASLSFLLFIMVAIKPSVLLAQKPLKVHATIITSYGNIQIHLYKNTPLHKANFLKLAKAHYFDSTEFHRVIEGFMIQGGDPYSKMPDKQDSIGEGGPDYELKAEFRPEYFHKRGVIAAARNGDDVNPERKSSGCQFYIVQGKIYPSDSSLAKHLKRVREGIKDNAFDWTAEQKKVYAEKGGTPWLDKQYTVFGEVVSGIEVVDAIAKAKKDSKDRPVSRITMKVVVGKVK